MDLPFFFANLYKNIRKYNYEILEWLSDFDALFVTCK